MDGIKARVAKANAEGELGDRKISLVSVDDGGDAARNVTAAQQLVEDDKVFAIMENSNAGDASGEYLNEQKVPVVGWQLGLPVYGTYPNFFGFQNANTKNIQTEFTSRNSDVIKALGGTKLAIVGSNAANSVIFTEQVKSAANKTKGMKTVYLNHDIPVGTTEFGAVVDQIKQSGADSMYTALDNNGNTGLMAALKQAGVTLDPVVFPGGYSPAGARPAHLRRRLLRHRVQALRDHPGVAGPHRVQEVDGQREPERAAQPDHRRRVAQSVNTLIEGIKAAGVNCPTRKAFINNLRLVEGLHRRRVLRRPRDHDRLRRGVRQAVPTACTTCTSRTSSSCPSSTASRSAPSKLITDNKITKVGPDHHDGGTDGNHRRPVAPTSDSRRQGWVHQARPCRRCRT